MNYFRPDAGGHLLHPAHQAARRSGCAREGALHHALRRHAGCCPYYQRFFLGGETQIRGFNIRTRGPGRPREPRPGRQQVRALQRRVLLRHRRPAARLLFFDAGQAFLEGEQIDLKQFRTSTGVELRFIMPVLNVPFRLIYAFNPNRDQFQPKSTFKFAVGTTF